MLASNFLVPNGTFIAELIAFLIVLFVIGKYVLPPLNRAMQERQEKVRAELAAADEARASAAAEEEQRRAALEEARARAGQIVEQARRTAEQVRSDAEARAQEEHDRIVSAAAHEIELARQHAVEQATVRMGEVVLDVVERVIGREVDAQVHRDLIDQGIAAITGQGTPGPRRNGEPADAADRQPSRAGAGPNA